MAGYAGLLLSTPTILYEIISYIVPGLTVSEKRLLAPVMFGSSALFFCGYCGTFAVPASTYGQLLLFSTFCSCLRSSNPTTVLRLQNSWHCRILFAYEILTPAALNFFVEYSDGAVESLWSIDQYFEFVVSFHEG